MVKEIQVPAYLCESCDKRYDDKRHAEDHERRLASKTKPFAYEIGQEPLWAIADLNIRFPVKIRINKRFRDDDHANRYNLEVISASLPEDYKKYIDVIQGFMGGYHERNIYKNEPKVKKPVDKGNVS